jgi:hypothetical protein
VRPGYTLGVMSSGRVALPVVAQELNELLGPKLVAYIAGVRQAGAVSQWNRGEREAAAPVAQRLRLALQVASLIARHDGASVARAWFQGLNPQLEDRSAARLLREGELDEVGPQLLSAARPGPSSALAEGAWGPWSASLAPMGAETAKKTAWGHSRRTSCGSEAPRGGPRSSPTGLPPML